MTSTEQKGKSQTSSQEIKINISQSILDYVTDFEIYSLVQYYLKATSSNQNSNSNDYSKPLNVANVQCDLG